MIDNVIESSYIVLLLKGAVSRNSAKTGYCKMPVKLKET